MVSSGWGELGRAAGVLAGVGTIGRGVVCGTRAGVEGTAGVISGEAFGFADSGGEDLGTGCRGRGDAKGTGDPAIVAAGLGVTLARGAGVGDARTEGVTVGTATGVVRAGGDTAAANVGLGVARVMEGGVGLGMAGVARTAGAGVAEAIVVGVVTELGLVGAAVAPGGVAEVVGGPGFTNVFEGASAGGVDSAFIFARARSAAARSASAAQLFSTVASAIVSFTVCGRSTPGTLVIAGADMTRISPRTVGRSVLSEFICRSRRYRSMGRRLRVRISSKFGPWLTIVVFEKVMLVTLVVSTTIVILRSIGTTER